MSGSSIPNWDNPNNCGSYSNGITFWRGSTKGNDYTLSYGVKFKSAIGIDVSSRHSYSSGSRLYYEIAHGAKRLCGKDDKPAKASKLQERF